LVHVNRGKKTKTEKEKKKNSPASIIAPPPVISRTRQKKKGACPALSLTGVEKGKNEHHSRKKERRRTA